MAYSSIIGADTAPTQPRGRDSTTLGPSDNSDSGSDTIGTHEAHADSDAVGTGERGGVAPDADQAEGADILPDHVIAVDEEARERAASDEDSPQDDVDADEFTDLDARDIGGDEDADNG